MIRLSNLAIQIELQKIPNRIQIVGCWIESWNGRMNHSEKVFKLRFKSQLCPSLHMMQHKYRLNRETGREKIHIPLYSIAHSFQPNFDVSWNWKLFHCVTCIVVFQFGNSGGPLINLVSSLYSLFIVFLCRFRLLTLSLCETTCQFYSCSNLLLPACHCLVYTVYGSLGRSLVHVGL